MRLFLSFLVLIFLFACTNHRDENQYDTNHAEVVDNPADLKRRDAETNEQAASASPTRTGHPSHIVHPTDKDLGGEKTKVPNTFASEAADASEGEVVLGEMAAQKTHSQKIVDFAMVMMKDHKAASDELRSLAKKKGIGLPSQCLSCEANYKDLHDLPTADFEKKYVEQMVTDHQKAVDLFTKASKEEQDPDLKKWAADKLPVLKHHLAMARELAKDEHVSAQKPHAAPGKPPGKSSGKKKDRKAVRS
jgi:predicted outer membrane protein